MNASRLLQQLDLSIGKARRQIDADCLSAEKAVYLIRLQADSDATSIIARLHQRYDQKPNVIISIWLNLAEGLQIYFSDMGTAANDKVRRAHALSAAAGIRPLHALSAAWLAQLDYMRHDIEAMARHVEESLRLAEPGHHSARSRASLVVAQALHHAGSYELAGKWHETARLHAIDEGDDATVSALIHNMAWLRMLTWRQGVLTGENSAVLTRHALMSAESTSQFDKLVGASTLSELHPLLKAQIYSLGGEYSTAVELYRKYFIDAAGPESVARLECNLLADLAWCHASLGDVNASRRYAALAAESLTSETHIDDRAATHSMLSNVYALLNDLEARDVHERLASQAWQANAILQARVVALLGEMSNNGGPHAIKPPPAPTPPVHTASPPAQASAP